MNGYTKLKLKLKLYKKIILEAQSETDRQVKVCFYFKCYNIASILGGRKIWI